MADKEGSLHSPPFFLLRILHVCCVMRRPARWACAQFVEELDMNMQRKAWSEPRMNHWKQLARRSWGARSRPGRVSQCFTCDSSTSQVLTLPHAAKSLGKLKATVKQHLHGSVALKQLCVFRCFWLLSSLWKAALVSASRAGRPGRRQTRQRCHLSTEAQNLSGFSARHHSCGDAGSNVIPGGGD